VAARHNAFYAGVALRPGCKPWTTDVCVPISRLAECVLETRADVQQAGILAPLVGHVGDGNFHLIFPMMPVTIAELQTAKESTRGSSRGRSRWAAPCSGEHGVGVGKMAYLQAEHGESLEVMQAIKRALDPGNRDELRVRSILI
jgi:D-lactate dehydrogenase (cytochrome)